MKYPWNWILRLALAQFIFLIGGMNPERSHAQEQHPRRIIISQYLGSDFEHVAGEILVKFREGTAQAQMQGVMSSLNAARSVDMLLDGWKLITVPSDSNLFLMIDRLKQISTVEEAEPNGVMHYDEFLPNDTYFASKQWALRNTGAQAPNSIVGSDIKATFAWDITSGSSSVKVAVLDTGIPLNGSGSLCHPDLSEAGRIILGADFTNEIPCLRDSNGHGTFVAGIIGAKSNNSTGIAGLAGGAKILVVKAIRSSGVILWNEVANAITYSRNQGAKVVNLSGGGWYDQQSEPQSVTAAIDASPNVLFVFPAGNAEKYNTVQYPARLALTKSNVVAVSATTHRDEFAMNYSCYGEEVTVSAPGGQGEAKDADDIYSTYPNYSVPGRPLSYGYAYGTSQAAPMVAGVAALIYSVAPPGGLTPGAVKTLLQVGADDLGESGPDVYFGYGRVNAYNSLVPRPPENLRQLGYTSESEPILNWEPAGEPDVVSYEVWRSINQQGGPPGSFTNIAVVTTNTYTDYGLRAGPGPWKVYYKVKAKDATNLLSDFSNLLTISASGFFKSETQVSTSAPANTTLVPAYPNPFNPSTTIRYGLPSRAHVSLTIFNTLGQQVATLVAGEQEAGFHEAVFDASGLASGVYLYRLQAGEFVQTRKLVLLQ